MPLLSILRPRQHCDPIPLPCNGRQLADLGNDPLHLRSSGWYQEQGACWQGVRVLCAHASRHWWCNTEDYTQHHSNLALASRNTTTPEQTSLRSIYARKVWTIKWAKSLSVEVCSGPFHWKAMVVTNKDSKRTQHMEQHLDPITLAEAGRGVVRGWSHRPLWFLLGEFAQRSLMIPFNKP